MNIFVLAQHPATAARAHCDSHVVKMILETTQILCGVHHRHGATFEGIYKPTHLNHPCTAWAARTLGNYRWTVSLLSSLLLEYAHRYNKQHACKALEMRLHEPPQAIVDKALPQEAFVFVGPADCRVGSDIVESYRALYNAKVLTMKRPMRWTRRQPPDWLKCGGRYDGVWHAENTSK